MSVSSWFRQLIRARTILPDTSQASQEQGNLRVEFWPAELPYRRRRLRRVTIFGFSPVSQVVLVLLGWSVILYLVRDPVDRIIPGFRHLVESMTARSAEGISQASYQLNRAVERVYRRGAFSVGSFTGLAPPEAGTRAIELPSYRWLPARPRLAVSGLRLTKGIRAGECAGGCSLVTMPDASLEPAIKKGQLLLIESGRTPAPGEVVWVAYRGRHYLRRYFPIGGRVRLAPENSTFRDLVVARKELRINGVFVRVVDRKEAP